jgi:hypothetical protein
MLGKNTEGGFSRILILYSYGILCFLIIKSFSLFIKLGLFYFGDIPYYNGYTVSLRKIWLLFIFIINLLMIISPLIKLFLFLTLSSSKFKWFRSLMFKLR